MYNFKVNYIQAMCSISYVFLIIGVCNQKCLETTAPEHASNKYDKFQQFEEVKENSFACSVFVSPSE